MRIPAREIADKKRIGSLKGRGVMAISGIGGIHLVTSDDGEILGAGSHPGLARHAARLKVPGIQFDDLQKSEALGLADIRDLIPGALELTSQLRAAQGLR